MIVAFTGHRPNKLGGYGEKNPLRDQIMYLICDQLDIWKRTDPEIRCISGMALGVDQWAAMCCTLVGSIPYVAAIPFAGQELKWPPESQALYRILLSHAEQVVTVSSGDYAASKMQRRNEWMVNNCDHLLAVWDGSPGGTANCIGYALAQKKPITYLRISQGKVVA